MSSDSRCLRLLFYDGLRRVRRLLEDPYLRLILPCKVLDEALADAVAGGVDAGRAKVEAPLYYQRCIDYSAIISALCPPVAGVASCRTAGLQRRFDGDGSTERCAEAVHGGPCPPWAAVGLRRVRSGALDPRY